MEFQDQSDRLGNPKRYPIILLELRSSPSLALSEGCAPGNGGEGFLWCISGCTSRLNGLLGPPLPQSPLQPSKNNHKLRYLMHTNKQHNIISSCANQFPLISSNLLQPWQGVWRSLVLGKPREPQCAADPRSSSPHIHTAEKPCHGNLQYRCKYNSQRTVNKVIRDREELLSQTGCMSVLCFSFPPVVNDRFPGK